MPGLAVPERSALQQGAGCLQPRALSWKQGKPLQCSRGTLDCEVIEKATAPWKSAWPLILELMSSGKVRAPQGCCLGLALEAEGNPSVHHKQPHCPSQEAGEGSPQCPSSPAPLLSVPGPRSQAPARLAECWVMGSRCWSRTMSSLDAAETPPAQASRERQRGPSV